MEGLADREVGGDDKKQGTRYYRVNKKKTERSQGNTTKEKAPPPESYRLTSTVSPACPQTQESSHRKFSTGCPLCTDGVMLECGQKFSLYALLYAELRLALDLGQWHTYKHIHTQTRILPTHSHTHSNNNNSEKDVGAIICIVMP